MALQEENCQWAKLYVTQALGSLYAQLMHWDHPVTSVDFNECFKWLTNFNDLGFNSSDNQSVSR